MFLIFFLCFGILGTIWLDMTLQNRLQSLCNVLWCPCAVLSQYCVLRFCFLQCWVAITGSQARVCFKKKMKNKVVFYWIKMLIRIPLPPPLDVTSGLFLGNNCFFSSPGMVLFVCLSSLSLSFSYVCDFLFHLYKKFCHALLLFVF